MRAYEVGGFMTRCCQLAGETNRTEIEMMKIQSILKFLLAIVSVPFVMTSCFGDDDAVSLDETCYISDLSLGTLKREMHTTTAEGKDSVYTLSYTGLSFRMSIDQKLLLVQNQDSLPYGTFVDAVPTKLTFSGVAVYKEADDEDWRTYSTADSINFTHPVQFKIYSATGMSSRTYTVKLNVHKVDGDVFAWNKLEDADVLDGLKERNLVALSDKLVMMAIKADGMVICATRSLLVGGQWTVTPAVGTEGADLTTLKKVGDQMLMSTEAGGLIVSLDGQNWTELATSVAGRRLIGTSLNYIYVQTDGVVACSGDGGLTWVENVLDDTPSNLPDNNVNMHYMQQDNGSNRLVLLGNSSASADGKVNVWSKGWRSAASEPSAKWMFYLHTPDNNVLLPQMDPLFVMPYDGSLIAMGGKTADGSFKALERIYVSPDYGLTWRPSDVLLTPKELYGISTPMAVALDKEQFIWVVVGKQTWRARLNRLGFLRQD